MTRLEYIQTVLRLVQYVGGDDRCLDDRCLDDNVVSFARLLIKDVVGTLKDNTYTTWLVSDILIAQSCLACAICVNHSILLSEVGVFFTELRKQGDIGLHIVLKVSKSLKPHQWELPVLLDCMPNSLQDNCDDDIICTVSYCVIALSCYAI